MKKKIETIFIKKETPLRKILSLPEITFKIIQYLKKSKKKNLVLEGASWIFYSFFVIFFLKIFLPKIKIFIFHMELSLR